MRAAIAAGCAAALGAPSQAQVHAPRDSDKPRPIPNYHVLTDTPRRNTSQQNFLFRAEISGAGRLLWAGDLHLAEYNGARIETDLRDIDSQCDFSKRRIATRNSGVVLSLAPVDLEEGYRFRLKTFWARRAPDCGVDRTDTSWINQPVEIEVGEPKVFTGDGGLVVRLTRLAWPD
ncbi:MAG: hypothetical protein QNI87_05740 [Erythrobacter sp.]|uniref:hypothetical protein n=1 Tax=Erythrobacter sp. TaxID=1042 RepID=UPI002621DC79|nr:hypothetical protein [Erythrobacter sp.]MDJ0978018.1 hypothetical protein [Erythrobacter sp.]